MSDEIEYAEKQIFNEKPDLSWPSVRHYLATRATTLFDLPYKKSNLTVWETLNPLPGFKEVTPMGYSMYFCGFTAWVIDAFDFFACSVALPEIASSLNVSITEISWGITLVLMLRSVGAAIGGILADYYGRKWVFIGICFGFIVIEIGTGFVTNNQQFLGVRAVFGALMGAMYGAASTTALEDLPPKARSVLSAFFLVGYNLGYLLATAFFRAFEPTYKTGEGWRSLFWFSAGLPLITIVWRYFLPETRAFVKLQQQKKLIKAKQEASGELINRTGISKYIDPAVVKTIKTEWLTFIYLVLLMAGMNFSSHGTQDLYPTILSTQYEYDFDTRTIILCVANIGAMVGGFLVGQLSELLGRRLTIIIFIIIGGAFLYPAYMVDHVPTIMGGSFFLVFCVMATYGISVCIIIELVNANYRAFLSGVVYQLGNLASSASSTIESKLSEQFPITTKTGVESHDYALVTAIFCGAIFAYIILITFLGYERFHRDLEIHSDMHSIREVQSETSSLDSKVKLGHMEKV